jgi:hypothetical protein
MWWQDYRQMKIRLQKKANHAEQLDHTTRASVTPNPRNVLQRTNYVSCHLLLKWQERWGPKIEAGEVGQPTPSVPR